MIRITAIQKLGSDEGIKPRKRVSGVLAKVQIKIRGLKENLFISGVVNTLKLKLPTI
jgi:hypothetical protein